MKLTESERKAQHDDKVMSIAMAIITLVVLMFAIVSIVRVYTATDNFEGPDVNFSTPQLENSVDMSSDLVTKQPIESDKLQVIVTDDAIETISTSIDK